LGRFVDHRRNVFDLDIHNVDLDAGGAEVEWLGIEEMFNLCIFDQRSLAAQHRQLLGNGIEAHFFVMLGKQNSIGKNGTTGAGNCDFHCKPLFEESIQVLKPDFGLWRFMLHRLALQNSLWISTFFAARVKVSK